MAEGKNEFMPEKETVEINGQTMEMRPTVARAVRSLRERMPNLRPNGIFQHPNDWTDEEIAFIADSLKMNVPLYTIANMVHCERHTLSRLVKSRPELQQLMDDKYENLLDEAEYQADRLMKAGNASIVIHVLQTLGRKRGWAEDGQSGGGADDSRVVMGLIPEAEVEKAETETKERQKDMTLSKIDPMQMALTEETVKAAVKEEMDRRDNVTEVEAEVSESPLAGGESVVDVANQRDFSEYGAMGMGAINPEMPEPDPWSDGANSMFFQ